MENKAVSGVQMKTARAQTRPVIIEREEEIDLGTLKG